MSSEVLSAVIAAAVSLTVATVTLVVSHRSTTASLRRDAERQDAEFRRTMTARLYDRRVATYPGLFQATSAFRRSRMRDAPKLVPHLRQALAEVDEWHSREGGLLLSPRGHQRLLDLRRAVRAVSDGEVYQGHLDELTTAIWTSKNELRKAMRADLGLLFEEDDG